MIIPRNLRRLHRSEEALRQKAVAIFARDERLRLHLDVVEAAMDLADLLRQFDTEDEDLKAIQFLGMRVFNALGASLKLTLSGYHQNGALILRDILETVFLLDLFSRDRSLIQRWRVADKKERMRYFKPVKVREALDTRDGFSSRKRSQLYEMFSELAGHPTMKAISMMRPEKHGDAVIGPFMEFNILNAVISEMGRLAIQVGEQLSEFFPPEWETGRLAVSAHIRETWISTFYPSARAG